MTTTLSLDELSRIRRELTDNVLAIGAFPYVDYRAVYAIIQANVQGSATLPTTTSTAVATANVYQTITVASAAGLSVGIPVQIDVGETRETVMIGALSGTTLSAYFRNVHSGTYNVEVESALTLVRGVLYDLAKVQDEINDARPLAGIKRADDTEFFGGKRHDGETVVEALRAEQYRLRMDLARMVGLGAYLAAASGRGGRTEIY